MTEILAAVKNGDKSAFEELLESFDPLLRSECARVISQFPETKGDEEEILQEGRLAIYSAAMAYKDGEVTFGLYAKICVRNRLISYLRRLRSAKRRKERAAAREVSEKPTHGIVTSEAISYDRLMALLEDEASAYEKRVFLMYIEKKSYAEIAQAVGKDEKSVGNAITRVKAKLKKRLS